MVVARLGIIAERTLLDGLGAACAACWIEADGVVLVGAETTVAGFSDRLGDGSDGVGGVHVLIVDGDLAATDDGKGVACFLAGGEGSVDKLGGLGGGRSSIGLAAEGGNGAGEAIRRIGGVVLELGLADGAHGLDGRGLIGLLAKLEKLRHGERHEDEHDGHHDEEFDQGKTRFRE